jgi:hypothetical protein
MKIITFSSHCRHSGTSVNYLCWCTYPPPRGQGFKTRWICSVWLPGEQTESAPFCCSLSHCTLSWCDGKPTEFPRWVDIIPISDSGYPRLISRSGERIFWKEFSSWYFLVPSRKFLNCASKNVTISASHNFSNSSVTLPFHAVEPH